MSRSRIYHKRPMPIMRKTSGIRSKYMTSEDGCEPGINRARRYWSLFKGTRREGAHRYTWKRVSKRALPWGEAVVHWQDDMLGFAFRPKDGDERLELRPCPRTVVLDAESYVNDGSL